MIQALKCSDGTHNSINDRAYKNYDSTKFGEVERSIQDTQYVPKWKRIVTAAFPAVVNTLSKQTGCNPDLEKQKSIEPMHANIKLKRPKYVWNRNQLILRVKVKHGEQQSKLQVNNELINVDHGAEVEEILSERMNPFLARESCMRTDELDWLRRAQEMAPMKSDGPLPPEKMTVPKIPLEMYGGGLRQDKSTTMNTLKRGANSVMNGLKRLLNFRKKKPEIHPDTKSSPDGVSTLPRTNTAAFEGNHEHFSSKQTECGMGNMSASEEFDSGSDDELLSIHSQEDEYEIENSSVEDTTEGVRDEEGEEFDPEELTDFGVGGFSEKEGSIDGNSDNDNCRSEESTPMNSSNGRKPESDCQILNHLPVECGLYNFGTSCYMNAVLQMLSRSYGLLENEALQGETGLTGAKCCNKKKCVAKVFTQTILKMKSHGEGEFKPEKLWNLRSKVSESFDGNEYQDCSEYLLALMNKIASQYAKHGLDLMKSPLTRFCGSKTSTLTSEECSHRSVISEDNIPVTLEVDIGGMADLQRCISNWFVEQSVQDYLCPTCEKPHAMKKSLQITEAPNYLCVALKRFGARRFEDGTFRAYKKLDYVKCNRVIHVPIGSSGGHENYKLAAIISHSGRQLHGGHYTSASWTSINEVRVYDDSQVRDVRENPFLDKNAYLILLEKTQGNNTSGLFPDQDKETENTEESRDDNEVDQQSLSDEDFIGSHGIYDDQDRKKTSNVTDKDSDDKEAEEQNLSDEDLMDSHGMHEDQDRKKTANVIDNQSCPLSPNYVKRILSGIEQENENKVLTMPPRNIKGGDIFLYRLKYDNDKGYEDDGYVFRNQKTYLPKGFDFSKIFYHLRRRRGGVDIITRGFEKHVYFKTSERGRKATAILIHYIGDEELAKPCPHGNSKSGKIFVRTSDSTKEVIKTAVGSKEAPKQIYNRLHKSVMKDLGCDYDDYEAVTGPRNTKQIKNFRYAANLGRRLMTSEREAIQEMSRQDHGKFIKLVQSVPSDIIVLAEPAMLIYARQILQDSSAHPDLPQLVTYDTTYNLGEAYVSAIVMRNIYFEGNPIFPVGFVIHERKKEKGHETYWKEIAIDELKFNSVSKNIPICCDRETAFGNVIRRLIPDANLIYCHNHLFDDVERWVKEAGGSKDDKIVLDSQLQALLNSKTELEFEELYLKCEQQWSQSFKEYSKKNLKQDIRSSSRFSYCRFKAFETSMPTNNLSESLNALLKRYQDYQELRMDDLVLALHQVQLELLLNFYRSYGYSGDYVLREEFKHTKCKIKLPLYASNTVEEFVSLFKSDDGYQARAKDVPSSYWPSLENQAKSVNKSQLLTIDSAAGTFQCRPLYRANDEVKEVKTIFYDDKHDQWLCSCRSPGTQMCYHRRAAERFMRKAMPKQTKTAKQLSELKSKRKKNAQKSGRKIPRLEDLDIIEAPDSDMAMRKKRKTEPDITDMIDSELLEVSPKKKSIRKTKKKTGAASTIKTKTNPAIPSNADTKTSNKPENIPCSSPIRGKENVRFTFPEEQSDNFFDEGILNGPAKVPFAVSKLFLPLNPGQELTGCIIDDIIHLIVASTQYNGSIRTCPLNLMELVQRLNYSALLEHTAQIECLNYDIILQPLNTDEGSGTHWVLGIIVFSRKVIMILDSLNSELQYKSMFRNLLQITCASYLSADLNIREQEWKFIIANDCAEQTNSYDCGLFVCGFVYAIVHGEPLDPVCNETSRNWSKMLLYNNRVHIKSLIHKFNKNVKIARQKIRTMQTQLRNLEEFNLVVTKGPCNNVLMEVLSELGTDWTICKVGGSACLLDKNHSGQQNFCVVCRKWFHEKCMIMSKKGKNYPDYYFCRNCNDLSKK